jgi:putative transferase (TIGR04331 family)
MINAMKVTLVSSRIKETFPTDGKIIFLGDWCLDYSEKSKKNTDNEIFNYHWNQPNRFYGDVEFLDDIYKEYIVKIKDILNKFHGTSYSERYWSIQVGWWLIFFIQVLFDRWRTVEKVAQAYPEAEVPKLKSEIKCPSVNDSKTFFERAANDEFWNERLYTDIFENFTTLKINHVNRLHVNEPLNKSKKHTELFDKNGFNIIAFLKDTFFKVLFSFTGFFLNIFYRNKIRKISLESTYLNRMKLLRLLILLKSPPKFFRPWNMKNHESLDSMRKWNFPNNSSSDFAKVLEFFLPKHLPRCFLEGFEINKKFGDQSAKSFKPEILVTANDFSDNDAWKFWASECVENGSKLVISQHGGGYGIAKYLATQNYEISISDRFLSWGWENTKNPKIQSAPAMKLIGEKSFKIINDGYCLLVSTSLPRHSYHLGSWPIGPQLDNYIQNQFDFVRNLSDVVSQNLAVRLSPYDLGWEHTLRWKDFNSKINLLPTFKDLNSYLVSTKLFIGTYNATTFLEAFKRNIPTVIFWDPNFWEINENAQEYFNFLIDAKVFFDNPKEAAKHVNDIWDNVPLWWNSKEVKSAISKFIEQYAYTGSNPLRELSSAILGQN